MKKIENKKSLNLPRGLSFSGGLKWSFMALCSHLVFKVSLIWNWKLKQFIKIASLCLWTIGLFISCKSNQENKKEPFYTILWSQTDTSYNNFRIPSIIVTKNNTILAFAEGREGGDSGNVDLLLKRSENNGKTWSDQQVIWDDGENTVGNPCVVIDQETGRIILMMLWSLGDDTENEIIKGIGRDTKVPYMTYSDDDGVTWAKPINLLKTAKRPNWGWYASGPGIGIQLEFEKYKNRLVIPCNNSYPDTVNSVVDKFGYGAHVLLSNDGGVNWRISELIAPKVNESQVVELANGDLLMNMRSYHGKNSRAISISKDGGESWSEVSHDEQLIDPICQAGLFKYGNFNDNELFLFSNPADSTHRINLTVKSSIDNCETWTYSKHIFQGPSAYSSLTKLSNGNVGILFEGGNTNAYEHIVFVSVPIEEIFEPDVIIPHF